MLLITKKVSCLVMGWCFLGYIACKCLWAYLLCYDSCWWCKRQGSKGHCDRPEWVTFVYSGGQWQCWNWHQCQILYYEGTAGYLQHLGCTVVHSRFV